MAAAALDRFCQNKWNKWNEWHKWIKSKNVTKTLPNIANPHIEIYREIGQQVFSVYRGNTDRHTDTQTDVTKLYIYIMYFITFFKNQEDCFICKLTNYRFNNFRFIPLFSDLLVSMVSMHSEQAANWTFFELLSILSDYFSHIKK